VVVAALLGVVAAAQIDRQCAQAVDRALQGRPVAFVRLYGGKERGEWHALSPALKHRIAVDPDIYSEVAQAWQLERRVVLVDIEARSLDFRANSTYCFRSSGSLARVIESSSGTVVRDDEFRYFDEHGKLVGRHSQFSSIYPHPGQTLSPDLKPSTPSLYLTVQALPFYAFLNGR
jgi:hypothetical protein